MADDKPIKPTKPYADFPLTPHNSGKWAKKIRGRLYYFGRWNDPDGALREFNAVKDALMAGRQPVVVSPSTITVRDLFNDFLNRQLVKVDAGQLEARTYQDAHGHLKEFAGAVGADRMVSDLTPADFAAGRASFAKHYGPHALSRAVSNVRTAFRYGADNGKAPLPPYGSQFDKESIRVKRRAAREKTARIGAKLFTPKECRELVAAAGTPLKAMILLGLNCGFYAIDCATLPMSAFDLDDNWIEFARRKTEVTRMSVLWPETVAAIREAIADRRKPASPVNDSLLFITHHGNPWVNHKVTRGEAGIVSASRIDSVNQAFTELLTGLGIRRKGINFAALRSTFRTAADELGDRNAVLMTMGHAFPGMDEFYVRAIAKKRLKRVADHVRKKLLNPKKVRAASRKKPARRRR